MPSKRELTAPCGMDCFNCVIYEDNLTDETAESIHALRGIPKEEIPCKGCRQQDGKHFHLAASGGCATLDCAKEKNVEFCCDCDDFPCSLLAPLADKADKFPHNFKVFNLCRIKKVGFEQWAENEAATIRRKYFTHELVVGKGQAD